MKFDLRILKNSKGKFTTIGIVSIIILTIYSHAVMIEPEIIGLENHPHPHVSEIPMDDANDLVASKQKSDMTYKQMMQRMGEAYNMIQRGIINQNKELVKMGAWMIDNHPAPKEKPWTIVKKDDKKAFKQTLLSFNDLLHEGTFNINEALKKDDWLEVNKEAYNLSNHCISCHSMWKEKTIK
jgi:hypothetical protein